MAERAVEADEGAARARGRAGARQVQRRASSAPCSSGFSDVAHRRGAVSGQVAAARRLEGRRLQHASSSGPSTRCRGRSSGASAGTCSRSAANDRTLHSRIKAHAFGNDFLLVDAVDFARARRPAGARAARCAIGTAASARDGLIVYRATPARRVDAALSTPTAATPRSPATACAASPPWIASTRQRARTATFDRHRDRRRREALELLNRRDGRYTFRAAMGQPEQIVQADLDVDGRNASTPSTLRVGNPQCVRARTTSTEAAAARRSAGALAVHPRFPAGHQRRARDGRGARPRAHPASGSAASGRPRRRAPAPAPRRSPPCSYGGAARDVQVVSPGGTPARRVGRRRAVPDRLGRAHRRRALAEPSMRRPPRGGRGRRDLLAGRGAVQSAPPDRRARSPRRCRCSCCSRRCRMPLAAARAPAGRDPGDDGRPLDHRGAAARGHRADRPGAGRSSCRSRRRATAFAPFADPIIFLFIGSFMLAEAMFVARPRPPHRLHGALSSRAVGRSPTRILLSSTAASSPASRCGSATPPRPR